MKTADRARATPLPITLRDGREMVIRALDAGDAEAFVAFYSAIPVDDNRYYIGPEGCTPEKARERAARADSPTEVALVIDGQNGQVYGEAWYSWKDEPRAKSTFGICISRAVQGVGAGKALMDRLMALAAEVGPPVMTLTVQKENARAVALYQKMGFAIVREQMRPARQDCPELPEYYMEKSLRA